MGFAKATLSPPMENTNNYESDCSDDDQMPLMSSAKFNNEFEMFGEVALGVMQFNHDLLGNERGIMNEALRGAQSVPFRFGAPTGMKRERDGASCVVGFLKGNGRGRSAPTMWGQNPAKHHVLQR